MIGRKEANKYSEILSTLSRVFVFPESVSEGFLLCRSSAGAELSFPLVSRGGAAELPSSCRRIENLIKPMVFQHFQAGPGPARARAGPGPGPGPARPGPGRAWARPGPGPGPGRARAGLKMLKDHRFY